MPGLLDSFRDAMPVTDPVVTFGIVMLIILIAPMAMRRMRMPGLIGVILAGAIIGPSALGILERDRTIELLGTVGLLYLMFMAGLSMDLQQFIRQRQRSIGFGFASFILPQTLGIIAGMYVLDFDPVQAVLLGSIVGSHTLLAYPVAKRLGITKNPAVTMSMGGTIVTDALALTVLAVIVAITVGDAGPAFWIQFIALVGAYVALVMFGLPRLGRWFFRNVQERGDVDFIFLLVVLFLSAALSDAVGLAPIIGAFLAGLVMNRLVPDSGPLMNRVQFVGEALFIPFFLLSVGMLVDFRVLAGELNVWWTAFVFTMLVFIGKFLAAGIARLAFKLSFDEGWTVFGLTMPQAAATLAVTLVGFDLGIFDDVAVNAVVMLMLATCLLGPWLVERFGRKVALAEQRRALAPGEAPQRILVPLANPTTADALMDIAFMLRSDATKEPVYPITVARDIGDVEQQVAESEKLLSHAVVHAAGANVPVVPLTRVDMNVANGIERAVRERRISMLVIGWNGAVTARQRLLGSILDQLLESLAQMVLICRVTDTPLNTTKRVVVMIPPLAEREPGFMDAIRTIKQLIAALGAKPVFILTRRTADIAGEEIEAQKPELTIETITLQRWSTLSSTLHETVEEEDVLLLLGSREGRVPWTPELGRLPTRLARSYREQNFVILYPSELEQEPEGRDEESPLASIATDRIALNLNNVTFENAVRQIMTPHFAENARSLDRAVDEAISGKARGIETIAPGAVLVHCHIKRSLAGLEQATVFLGISRSGLDMPGTRGPVHVLAVLLSPSSVSSDQHLRTLGEVANELSRPQVIETLRSAATVSDVQQALQSEGQSDNGA